MRTDKTSPSTHSPSHAGPAQGEVPSDLNVRTMHELFETLNHAHVSYYVCQ